MGNGAVAADVKGAERILSASAATTLLILLQKIVSISEILHSNHTESP